MKRIASLVAAATLVMVGCSDDKNNNPTPDNSNYFPTTQGSYWVSDTKELSGDASNPTEKNPGVDSTFVNRTNVTVGGQVATEFVTHSTVGETMSMDTVYFRNDASKTYRYFELAIDGITGMSGVDLGARWMLMADANATAEWTSLDETINDIPLTYQGMSMKGTAKLKFTGKKVGAETLTVGGTAVTTLHYTTTLKIDLSIDTQNPIFGTITVPISTNTDVWVAKNIGIVKTLTPPSKITVGSFGNVDIDGSSNVLVRYSIK